jgi:hypothetical protein
VSDAERRHYQQFPADIGPQDDYGVVAPRYAVPDQAARRQLDGRVKWVAFATAVLAVLALVVPSMASAHKLGKGDSALETRLVVSEAADADCELTYDYDEVEGVETVCDFADFPRATRRDCWRTSLHRVGCDARVTFSITFTYDDGIEEYLDLTCTYRTTSRYFSHRSVWPSTRITAGPRGCF